MKFSESSVNCVAVALDLMSANLPQKVLLSKLWLSSVKQISGSNYKTKFWEMIKTMF
jgi:hypothetical protein